MLSGLFWRGLVYQQGIVQIFESHRFIREFHLKSIKSVGVVEELFSLHYNFQLADFILSFLHLIKAYQRQENATTSESDAETCMKTMSEVNSPFFCFAFFQADIFYLT